MSDMSVIPVTNDATKLPPCKWYVSVDQPECGKPAPFKLKVKGKVTQAVVDVCEDHKALHDREFARLRTSGRAS